MTKLFITSPSQKAFYNTNNNVSNKLTLKAKLTATSQNLTPKFRTTVFRS